MSERYQRTGAFSRVYAGIIVFCVVRMISSMVLFARFLLCRMLVLLSIYYSVQTTTTIPT